MRRRTLLAGAVAGVPGFALSGCISYKGLTFPETERTPTTTEKRGSVARNAVPELAVVGYDSDGSGDRFRVWVTFENTGDRRTSLGEYDVRARLYEDGDRLDPSGMADVTHSVAPGERAPVALSYPVDGGRVTRYEIVCECELSSDGVYC